MGYLAFLIQFYIHVQEVMFSIFIASQPSYLINDRNSALKINISHVIIVVLLML